MHYELFFSIDGRSVIIHCVVNFILAFIEFDGKFNVIFNIEDMNLL